MRIEVDDEFEELDEETGVFIRSVCAVIDKTPLQLTIELLKEYERQFKLDIEKSGIH